MTIHLVVINSYSFLVDETECAHLNNCRGKSVKAEELYKKTKATEMIDASCFNRC